MVRTMDFFDKLDDRLINNFKTNRPLDCQKGVVWDMTSDELRCYTFHYIDIDTVIERKFLAVCEDCPDVVRQDDINDIDCSVCFDVENIKCRKASMIDYYLRYLISADLFLRTIMGDLL